MALGFISARPASVPAADLSALSDEQLLARFFQKHEDAAFEAIVKRHGPVVYGVCRRILSDSNDAEDAFQATFLVLVRKGASLRQPGRLSAWLYGVANRTARKFRLQASLRTRSEQKAGERPLPVSVGEMTYDELRTILDEEIAALPEKYALPLVLCYLEGKTNAQAAAQLGWPEGSMSRRLARGRELLRSRLTRRGLAITAALIVAVFTKSAPACVPGSLAAATVQAGHLVIRGARVQDVLSYRAAKVVAEILTTMSTTSRTISAALLAAASILLVLTTAIWQFGGVAFGANLFDFSSDDWFNGKTGTISLSSPLVDAQGVAVGCGSASDQTVLASHGTTPPTAPTATLPLPAAAPALHSTTP